MSANRDHELSLLREMFPESSIASLNNALASANNDLELALSILLSESNQDEEEFLHKDPLIELYDILPELQHDVIRKYYTQNNESVPETIDALLNQQNHGENSNKNNAWHTKPKLEEIIHFTNVDDSVARKLFFKNSMNVIATIVYIINNKINVNLVENKTIAKPVQGQKIGGRVQFGHGLAHAAFPASTKPNCQPKPYSNENVKCNFIYNEQAPEVIELNKMLNENLEIREINPHFLKNCLDYYNGNLTKVLDLAILIIDKKATKLTYNQKKLFEDGFQIVEPRKSRRVYNHTNSRLSPVSKNDVQLENKIFETYTLDFHGYLPQQAVSELDKALNIWWDYEMSQRELNSKNLNGTNACCVKSLRVITGRGLHSLNGISKVRQKVQKHIDSLNFVYWEEPSYFIIYGKKISSK
ncbi:hypothetical protein KAFR_0D03410 [Kazachstania africana CBS 2517]|uniref:Smr domain-containing protein n=1 Tax=Kazachstania africana (strain ATCC 22294 / BCRC 22015 / CBS 2517 / CECT 1963 / NBRC 1671 / NRRL Y-8276) TaxID=1071382 RepID=H2AUD9_KAZAF|nr:hypothetical protein KAFR_0D03410 [Kazachstania africana CBS 2517]CCF57989.1 hypothetical protein KAFR_0D03410 [Kazachstania africana CBS 2517]